jgi:hypothetical protein
LQKQDYGRHRSGQRTDYVTRRRKEDKGTHSEKSKAGQVKGKRRNKDMVPAHIQGERRGQARTERKHEKTNEIASTDSSTGN